MKTYAFVAFIISTFFLGMVVASNIEYCRNHKKDKFTIYLMSIGFICFGYLVAINYFN
jgi:hypothetical protein